ncbi:MAG: dihydrofolate reductase [Candidatus Accumulibacter phosphatis]|jgi:dihydrofolate reductase|uniref:Dihydrofolate reductase n=2 Tax=Candidatus Accumulibacter TaxID=327159 RepID=A0A084Y6Z5_9PROT|nr:MULTISPECIES: dihydrofolate reductase [Candidatus Accumulibacter]KFB70489.1 MAG: Dihydrofolate reductase [Candidatus Accumulibacter phosphatis]MBL8406505.1 dihydrofolate reductase [Accumulibacter sp.]NMQ07513.1 dihydrofolate reductase [Candidatus Accumulibacter contiguus]HCZ14378.1 dihydrofolate reductase [Accumulibacter sp.]HRF11567.1 dihydrofolate reductase [Candidatus Accumulibacter phosphatis]
MRVQAPAVAGLLPRISLIAVVASNRAIGKDQQLLWHLPEDLRNFRETTRGKPVIMGRKTWESLPTAFRPLPGRHNIVVSRNPGYLPSGATPARSLEEAIALAGEVAEVFIIGGEELYRQTLPLAKRLYLTEVAENAPGDRFFPEVSLAEWREVSRRTGNVQAPAAATPGSIPAFDFVIYEHR